MHIDKKFMTRIAIVIAIIVIAIISVNIRIGDKMKKEEEEFIGYVPDDENMEQIIGDEPDNSVLAIYDFDQVMPYFEKFEESMLFKDYLNDYIVATGTNIHEWWIKDINFDEVTLTLSFFVKTRDSSETYYVEKNNEGTIIERSILKDEIK